MIRSLAVGAILAAVVVPAHAQSAAHGASSAPAPVGVTNRPAALDSVLASATPVTLLTGDVVRMTVWGRAELSGEFSLNADGTLNHPILQEVRLVGLTLEEARRRMRELLERFESNPQFVLEPLVRVAVGGEVRQPNLYVLPTETALYQVIAMAGGPSERGRLDRVRLVRDGDARVMDLSRADSPEALVPIRSGDRLMVERRRNILREYVIPALTLAGSVASLITVSRRF